MCTLFVRVTLENNHDIIDESGQLSGVIPLFHYLICLVVGVIYGVPSQKLGQLGHSLLAGICEICGLPVVID